jgi:hypothetical protein
MTERFFYRFASAAAQPTRMQQKENININDMHEAMREKARGLLCHCYGWP